MITVNAIIFDKWLYPVLLFKLMLIYYIKLNVFNYYFKGQTPMKQRIEEIEAAVAAGAKEIDIVITRSHVLSGNWQALYEEILAMRKACGEAHLKTILATGECGSLTNVYKASLVAMMAGSDFIKTSTGKESLNATFPVALVMVRAIRDYYQVGYRLKSLTYGNLCFQCNFH